MSRETLGPSKTLDAPDIRSPKMRELVEIAEERAAKKRAAEDDLSEAAGEEPRTSEYFGDFTIPTVKQVGSIQAASDNF